MRKWTLFIAAAVFAALTAGPGLEVAYCADAAQGSPKIEVSPEAFDFGTINEGDKPMAVFTIKNTGGAELVIYDAKPSCGCTLAQLSSKKLMPGETARLETVYNSQNAGGKVSKYVTVKTNDPVEPSKMLRITGTVKSKPAPMLNLSQYRSDNMALAAGAVDKKTLQLTNSGQEDLLITEMTTTPGMSAKLGKYSVEAGKTVKMELVVKPGEVMEMEVELSPKAPAGSQFQELVTIRSNSKGRPAVSFLAKGLLK